MTLISKVLLSAAWITLVGTGFGYAWRYESTAGAPAAAVNWPAGSAVRLDASRPTLVMFAHPNCPCTKVSIEQLAELTARNPGKARTYVVLVQAPGLSGDLAQSAAAVAARKIEGVVLLTDSGGREVKRFEAVTSGQVIAFAPSGEPLFRGGVTAARGHYGPNAGIDAIASVLDAKAPTVRTTPVYGCSLLGSSERVAG